MELTLNIILITLYVLSILQLGLRMLLLGACHGDPKGALQARNNFLIALAVFFIMSALMIFRFSVWFGMPVVSLFVIAFLVILYDEIDYRILVWKDKKTPIDPTE